MNRLLPALALVLLSVPISSCNQQTNRHAGVHERGEGREARGGRGLRKACGADLQKYCASQERGRERRDCLQSHVDQLSADCKAALQARGEHRRRRNF
jgi:hypothetical protein